METTFRSGSAWFRDFLACANCGSVPRERALALILNEIRPDWRQMSIHESSPSPRGISAKVAKEAAQYVGTQYMPDQPFGEKIGTYRNEDLQAQTFADGTFDIVLTLDVMEHVYEPAAAFTEIYRTLKPGGVYICTFPVRKGQVAAWERRFEELPDGTRRHFKPPEIHGNPVSKEGSIVTVDWGYDLHQQIAEWAPFDVRVCRFADQSHGIMGEYTEVIISTKRATA
jgi:SAM-dependent methyltransferase